MSRLMEDIPEKCLFCNKKAEYFYIEWGFWGVKTRFLCEKHKNELTNRLFKK